MVPLAFPSSFYLCCCAAQKGSCQHNIHYYSDKNRVAFTSVSWRQHYSLLQNSNKNRRSRPNYYRLAAELWNRPSLLQVDEVWSEGANSLWSLWVLCLLCDVCIREEKKLFFHQHKSQYVCGAKMFNMSMFPGPSIRGNWIRWAAGPGGFLFPQPDTRLLRFGVPRCRQQQGWACVPDTLQTATHIAPHRAELLPAPTCSETGPLDTWTPPMAQSRSSLLVDQVYSLLVDSHTNTLQFSP